MAHTSSSKSVLLSYEPSHKKLVTKLYKSLNEYETKKQKIRRERFSSSSSQNLGENDVITQTYAMDIFDSMKNPQNLGWGQVSKDLQFKNVKLFIPFLSDAYQWNNECMKEMFKALRKENILIIPIIMEKNFRPRSTLEWLYHSNLSIIHFYKFDDIDEFVAILAEHVGSVLRNLKKFKVVKDPYQNVKRLNGPGLAGVLKTSIDQQKVKIRNLKQQEAKLKIN